VCQDALIHAVVERSKTPTCNRSRDSRAERDVMTWEWEHRNNRGQWVLTVGTWHAVVQRLAGSRPMWQAAIERTTLPHERYESQAYPEAVDARTWCLRKIAELASAVP
jgi:hypothetical protein